MFPRDLYGMLKVVAADEMKGCQAVVTRRPAATVATINRGAGPAALVGEKRATRFRERALEVNSRLNVVKGGFCTHILFVILLESVF